jgi:hypothetical protein
VRGTIGELQFLISRPSNGVSSALCLGFFLIIKTLLCELKLFHCCFEVGFVLAENFVRRQRGMGKRQKEPAEGEAERRGFEVKSRFETIC